MSGAERSIQEADLHAYVDGQLDPSRMAAVEQYLAAEPEEALRVAAYSAHRSAMRAMFTAHAAGPLPPELDLSRLIQSRLTRRRATGRMIAAGVALFALGGIGGWWLHAVPMTSRDERAMAVLQQQALATHIVYAADQRHPVELDGTDRDHLMQWLSNRLNRPITAPDLTGMGYRLIGGRLLATERGGAAALLLYEDDAHTRLSVVIRPMAPDLRAAPEDTHHGPISLSAWIDKGLGYAVVAALPDGALDRATEAIKQETASAG